MEKTEFYSIKAKAFLGDGEALFEYAWMHVWGLGCEVDFDKAYSLMEKSYKHGFSIAKDSLNDTFKKENGKVSLASPFSEMYESLKKIRLSAEEGDPFAQFLLAQPKVTEKNITPYMKKRGLFWLEKSAKQSFPPAMFLLGILHLSGDGVPCDNDKGMALIRKAAENEEMGAIKYLAKEEPQFVIPILNKLDSEANSEAQEVLGQMYLAGVGVEKDVRKGIEYWEKAASNGSSDAMFNLGICYEQGVPGITEDIDKAIYWLEKGSELGNATCMANLGNIIQDKEPERAFELYSKAAEMNEPHALNNLGTLYKRGLGCEKSPEKALSCYEKSASAGCVSAMSNLVRFYTDDVAVQHDYEKANTWLLMAADYGDEESVMVAARGYMNGSIFQQDYRKAIHYFKIAAEQNNPEAMVNLGKLYRWQGDWRNAKKIYQKAIDLQYIPAYYEFGLYYCYPEVQNYEEATRLFSIAADAGYPPAEYELGVCYRFGDGVVEDMDKAIYWMTKASKDGYHMATNNLGLYYLSGNGVERNPEKAVECFRDAAENGIVDSQTLLGRCYFYGEGVTQNYQEAYSWFAKAAEQNEPDAQYHLYLCYSKGLGVSADSEKAMQYLHLAAEEGKLEIAIQELEGIESEN